VTELVTLGEIAAARRRIAAYVRHTPVLPPPALPDLPPQLRLKLENLQVTGSFKVRGAFNALLQLNPARRARGVVAASGGNHGVAVAYAAYQLGVPATIYLPATAADDRAARVARWGAAVVRIGAVWDEAHARAREQATATGQVYLHPFADRPVIAGQGTLGLELLDDLPELDAVLVAIGGGGLIAGVAAALKESRPEVRVVGVEPVGAASMRESRRAGQVVALPAVRTIADTLAPRAVAERTLAHVRRYVDEIVLVEDRRMVEGMRWLWHACNQLVEPAGAAVIAALLDQGNLVGGCRCPVALICGGNAAAEPAFAAYEQAAYPPA
jgi:threonine dehydratase